MFGWGNYQWTWGTQCEACNDKLPLNISCLENRCKSVVIWWPKINKSLSGLKMMEKCVCCLRVISYRNWLCSSYVDCLLESEFFDKFFLASGPRRECWNSSKGLCIVWLLHVRCAWKDVPEHGWMSLVWLISCTNGVLFTVAHKKVPLSSFAVTAQFSENKTRQALLHRLA